MTMESRAWESRGVGSGSISVKRTFWRWREERERDLLGEGNLDLSVPERVVSPRVRSGRWEYWENDTAVLESMLIECI